MSNWFWGLFKESWCRERQHFWDLFLSAGPALIAGITHLSEINIKLVSCGKKWKNFPGIALKSTGASAFQPIRTRHAEHSFRLKGNCHELRMHLSKFVCDNMPGFLATFRSRNLLFCLDLFRCQSPVICGRFCLASMPS